MRLPPSSRATTLTVALLSSFPVAISGPSALQCAHPAQAFVRLQRLGDAELKALYLACTRVSEERRLSFDEAAGCSVAAEMLKVRVFDGDFDALLAWWRASRDKHSTADAQVDNAIAATGGCPDEP